MKEHKRKNNFYGFFYEKPNATFEIYNFQLRNNFEKCKIKVKKELLYVK